jgi:hypothetical protein
VLPPVRTPAPELAPQPILQTTVRSLVSDFRLPKVGRKTGVDLWVSYCLWERRDGGACVDWSITILFD